MGYEYDYEEELAWKDREIQSLEEALSACRLEIRRLRSVCREYEERLRKYEIGQEGETNEDHM